MKKTIIALAVAGALTAPMIAQADATLYGSLAVEAVKTDSGELNVSEGDSFVGLRGDVKLGLGDTKGIYNLEVAVDTGDSTDAGSVGAGRIAYVGATGGWGTAVAGRVVAPHYSMVTATTDNLEFNSKMGVTQDVERVGSTVAYFTPEMGGFQAAVAVVSDNNASGEDVDAYNLAATYTLNDLTVGASKVIDNVNNNADVTAVSVAYTIDALDLGVLYQDKEATDVQQWELAAAYTMGDTTFAANYADVDNDGTVIGVEVQKQLGASAYAYAGYQSVNDEAALSTLMEDQFTLGYRINF